MKTRETDRLITSLEWLCKLNLLIFSLISELLKSFPVNLYHVLWVSQLELYFSLQLLQNNRACFIWHDLTAFPSLYYPVSSKLWRWTVMILNWNFKHIATLPSFSTSSWHSWFFCVKNIKLFRSRHGANSSVSTISQSFLRNNQIPWGLRKALLCAETIACEMWLNVMMPYGRHYMHFI